MLIPTRTKLYQVTAPHFCAGFVVEVQEGRIVETAPILHWMKGKSWGSGSGSGSDLKRYFARKGWLVAEVLP